MLWRVNKGGKERQAHTLGVHFKKGVHLIEVSVKRELTVLLLTSVLETYMHSVDKAGGKDGRLCSQIIFWASVGAMTENNIQPPRGLFPCGKKIVCRKIKPLLPT